MKIGRKLFDGKDFNIVIAKLEQVWSVGGSDKEASFYANIDPSALSRFLKSHPNISQRKQALLNNPNLKARFEMIKGMKDNPEFALKYVERKLPDEFAVKNRVEITGQNIAIELRQIALEKEKLKLKKNEV